MTSDLVLLVDDEANIIQLSRLCLEREGFQVQAIGDGLEALKAVDRLNSALVVLDIMLLGLDGLEVCKRLRASNKLVPILMLTAWDEDIDKILGLELGADDYMTKPFNPRELVARVKAILRRSDRPVDTQTNVFKIGDLVIDPARADKSRRGNEKRGIGLGLPIATQIVLAHHGEIWVESDPGKGSTFLVRVPVSLPSDSTIIRSRRSK